MARVIQKEKATSERLAASERELAAARAELQELMIQGGLDAAGILDPTPTSDLLGAAYSVSRGDWGGAVLSLVSVVPYIGDVIAKPAKGTKLAKAIAKASSKVDSVLAKLNKIRAKRRKAANMVRAARDKAKQARQKAFCEPCTTTNPYGARVPKTGGQWKAADGRVGQRGNSLWHPTPGTAKTKEIDKITGGKPIRFKDGYPDFSAYSNKDVKINMTGDDYWDFKRANEKAGFNETPEGFTWHHHQDGETMQLIPSELHNNVPHTGGASVVADKEF